MLNSLKRAAYIAATIFASGILMPTQSFADSQPYVGDVMPVAFSYCPVGWTAASGGVLSIVGNEGLFSLVGTTYGGDGVSTFGLPDLRGRHAFGYGQSPGLSFYPWGSKPGSETVVLNQNNLPSHSHDLNLVAEGTNVSSSPVGASIFERNAGAANAFRDTSTNLVAMSSQSIANAGQNQPIDIRSPALAILWCIALRGQFPNRP
ncbi:MAG: tail fiber protein [Pseudomonadota bacterium]